MLFSSQDSYGTVAIADITTATSILCFAFFAVLALSYHPVVCAAAPYQSRYVSFDDKLGTPRDVHEPFGHEVLVCVCHMLVFCALVALGPPIEVTRNIVSGSANSGIAPL